MSKRRNAIESILIFNQRRDPERLVLKYRAMRADAFAFLRGTCHLFYQDWPADSPLNDAPPAWICGDLHLENFGSFKGDNRLTYFDLNDFDEAALAPATWELARFLTSVLVAAKTLGVNHSEAIALVHCFLDCYTAALQDGKARWLERATAEGMVKSLLSGLGKRTRPEFLDSRTKLKGGKRMLRLDGKRALPASDADYKKVVLFMAKFAALQPDPKFFKVLDVARRIAGTGSLGTERYVILVEGAGSPSGNYLLDLKHEPGSALAPYLTLPQPEWGTEAERVVSIQRRVQAISPAFLNAVQIGKRSYVMRELLPDSDRLQLEMWNGKLRRLENVMKSMGKVVAWGHLRSGGRQGSAVADEWISFASNSDWRSPLLEYAEGYARQVETDWNEFCESPLNFDPLVGGVNKSCVAA
ncbi:hypothetical protein SCT_2125 [Sulfuricella sp. T08]|uniref:DUF2252 domain-containing protein n=1 Tax=Sulfuricella sp. T08 TaxID=1632857 RepID=UPI000617A09B|nr:DUF2252 domain-containing protein [Sulfuricella sp. T08]GAO36715.1 hypothetical protein SCT_2125 [Sulfuricella sp. T08]